MAVITSLQRFDRLQVRTKDILCQGKNTVYCMQFNSPQTPNLCGFRSILVKNYKRREKLWELAILKMINPLVERVEKGIK
jgi:hypothetical protein